MKFPRNICILTLIFSMTFPFNIFAMNIEKYNYDAPVPSRPETEQKHSDRSMNYEWYWVEDDLCIKSKASERTSKSSLRENWNLGFVPRLAENGKAKTRDSYSGKWSQNDSGIWSFVFDDYTIPVGVTKIDDVLYAFTGYGELKEGYEYYEGLKTGADGLVVTDNADLDKWLETEYLPSCTSHKE